MQDDYPDALLEKADLDRKAEKENRPDQAELIVERIRATGPPLHYALNAEEARIFVQNALDNAAAAALMRAAKEMRKWASGDVVDALESWAKSEEDAISERIKNSLRIPKEPKL